MIGVAGFPRLGVFSGWGGASEQGTLGGNDLICAAGVFKLKSTCGVVQQEGDLQLRTLGGNDCCSMLFPNGMGAAPGGG